MSMIMRRSSLACPDPTKGLTSINVGRLLNKGKLADFLIFLCALNRAIFHYRCPTKLFLHLCEAIRLHISIVDTVFLRSDAAATIYFAVHFVWLLFEGGVYLFGKPGDINNGWIRYERVRQWWLLDAVSSMHSLSVLLSAVGTTCTTQTVLALARWLLSKIICTRVRVPRLLATATICLFCSRAAGTI